MATTVNIRSTNRLPCAVGTPADPTPDHRVPHGALRRIVGRWHSHNSCEGPQTLLDAQDLSAGPPRPWALAVRSVVQGGFDFAPQPDHRTVEAPPIYSFRLEVMPPSEQPVRQSQQFLPDRFGGAAPIDHRLEIPAEMAPADLPAGPDDPVIGAQPIGHRDRALLGPQHGLSHLGIALAGDREDRDQPGDRRPEPSLAPLLTPRGLIGVDHLRGVDRGRQFVVRGLQRQGRLPLQLGDHPGRDRQSEHVTGQLLDLPLAQAVGPGQRGQDRLHVRTKADGGNARGQGAAGGLATVRARQAMQTLFVQPGARSWAVRRPDESGDWGPPRKARGHSAGRCRACSPGRSGVSREGPRREPPCDGRAAHPVFAERAESVAFVSGRSG